MSKNRTWSTWSRQFVSPFGKAASAEFSIIRRLRQTYYTILYYTILYHTILCYTMLYYTIPHHTILYDNIRGPRAPKKPAGLTQSGSRLGARSLEAAAARSMNLSTRAFKCARVLLCDDLTDPTTQQPRRLTASKIVASTSNVRWTRLCCAICDTAYMLCKNITSCCDYLYIHLSLSIYIYIYICIHVYVYIYIPIHSLSLFIYI